MRTPAMKRVGDRSNGRFEIGSLNSSGEGREDFVRLSRTCLTYRGSHCSTMSMTSSDSSVS